MTKLFQIQGIVIHSRDFGEKDALLTVLSKEKGKISFVCKGVKKPVSSMRAAAQLFSHGRFFLYEGASLPVATQAEFLEGFKTLAGDLQKFAVVSYWLEMVNTLLPDREMNFSAYLLLLKGLRLLDKKFSWPLYLAFQVKILALAGFQPVYDHCAQCGGEINGPKCLSPTAGGVLCGNCGQDRKQVAEGTIQSLHLFSIAELGEVTEIKMAKQVHAELEKFLRNFIEYHTEHGMKAAAFTKYIDTF